MNEAQIIREQLVAERGHVEQIVASLPTLMSRLASDSTALDSSGVAGEFHAACADYFAFVIRRLDETARAEPALRLGVVRACKSGAADGVWREFLNSFNGPWRKRLAHLDTFPHHPASITQLRALAAVDADSILEERTLFARVRAFLT